MRQLIEELEQNAREAKKAEYQKTLDALALQGVHAIPFDEIDPAHVGSDEIFDFAMYGRAGQQDAVIMSYTPSLCRLVIPEIKERGLNKLREFASQLVVWLNENDVHGSWKRASQEATRIMEYGDDRINTPKRRWLENPQLLDASRDSQQYLRNLAVAIERAFPIKEYRELAECFGFELVPEAIAYQYVQPIVQPISGSPPVGISTGSLVGRTKISGHEKPVWKVEVHYVLAEMAGRVEHHPRISELTTIIAKARGMSNQYCHLRT